MFLSAAAVKIVLSVIHGFWVDRSYPYLMIFSGDSIPNFNRRSLAVEPMTCAPNAFRSGDGLIRLEPGSSLTSTWGISHGSVR